MRLYHGSNVKVENPRILKSERNLDFGEGFYLTTDFEQAKKWAISTTKRRDSGKATISIFEIDEKNMKNLNIKKFKCADKKNG